MASAKDIQDAVKSGSVVMGTRNVIKAVKAGGVGRIVHASNVPDITLRELRHYSSIASIEVSGFDGTSIKLGEVCGKPFGILVIGVAREAKAGKKAARK
ncbi:MAG: ribosomal L7Ae/L30e/S12e/Gadd45 family protein [Candidatus Aenigmarchaeota archaeon]|nr:ribosomal L7Ae/L30e/S12e/Gadd45 family protein [Candidatus Aenigmarchaeota archaeon]